MAYGDNTERQIKFTHIATRERRVEGKDFALHLRENRRGKYVVLAEFANGRRNDVVIPATSLRDLISDLQDLADEAGQ